MKRALILTFTLGDWSPLRSGHKVSVMGGGGFLRGVCNKNVLLRRGFKQIAKKCRGMKQELLILQNFTNNLASHIAQSFSHNLMILLQCYNL